MTHAALAPGIGREFEPFLFASVGEGRHGHSLSVLSALAQSDVDPWLEAVGLARMSRELATARLSRLIAALPSLAASDRSPDLIAQELVALLPQRRNFTPTPPAATPTPVAPARTGLVMSVNFRFGIGLGVLALMIAAALLFSTQMASRDATSPSTGERSQINSQAGRADPNH